MSKVERFEDLRCWQVARELVKLVYKASEAGVLSKDFDTKSQLRRAALLVMNNIAEGFGRFSEKDFIKFLNIAQSSAMEVKSICYVLLDMNCLEKSEVKAIQQLTEQSKANILALIKYLKNRNTPN